MGAGLSCVPQALIDIAAAGLHPEAKVSGVLANDPDLDERGLSGLTLQHDLFLTVSDSAAWGAVTDALACAGAELQSLQLMRQGEGYAARCRLTRISAEQVRRLSEDLIERGVVCYASVEHLMLRETGRAS